MVSTKLTGNLDASLPIDGWHKGSLVTEPHCQISQSPLASSAARAAQLLTSPVLTLHAHVSLAAASSNTAPATLTLALHFPLSCTSHAHYSRHSTNMWNVFKICTICTDVGFICSIELELDSKMVTKSLFSMIPFISINSHCNVDVNTFINIYNMTDKAAAPMRAKQCTPGWQQRLG